VHTGSHPGYSAALTDKIREISINFNGAVNNIPDAPGSLGYESAYQRLVDVTRTRLDAVQVKCRDHLQKGAAVVGDSASVAQQWALMLKGL
jgi:hypothetical protein